jgi:hypothetical protein
MESMKMEKGLMTARRNQMTKKTRQKSSKKTNHMKVHLKMKMMKRKKSMRAVIVNSLCISKCALFH